MVTDHGAFVLFNVYGPAIAGDDKAEARFAFKLAFYEVRMACSWLAQLARCSTSHPAGDLWSAQQPARLAADCSDLNVNKLSVCDLCTGAAPAHGVSARSGPQRDPRWGSQHQPCA